MHRSNLRPLAFVFPCVLAFAAGLTPLAGCKGSGKGADDPVSAGGAKVKIMDAAPNECTKIGTAKGSGRDGNEGLAEQQANDATREQAAQLGGNAMVWVDSNAEKEAGSGGPVTKITRTADVYNCPAAAPASTDSAAPATSST
jgi:hypothetical protein